MRSPDKVCPILLCQKPYSEILLFEHPLAGVQLVKGSIETDEQPDVAALRELQEEAGITTAVISKNLGLWNSGYTADTMGTEHIWSLYLCETAQPLPDEWTHYCTDDGGHLFRFFWYELYKLPPDNCHPLFQNALLYIQTLLTEVAH